MADLPRLPLLARDPLLVDGNPLQDVRALSAISLVLMKGERVARNDLFEQK